MYFITVDMHNETEFSRPVLSPHTVTITLAYLHRYTPAILPRRRLVAARHLREMANWLGYPRPDLRSIRHHHPLAAHFALLHASRFVSFSGAETMLLPGATSWLHAGTHAQIDRLLAVLEGERWQQALTELGLQTVLKPDYTTYLQQVLQRQDDAPLPSSVHARLQVAASKQVWSLCLSPALPTWLTFDLLQLGHWQPQRKLLRCTALTVGQAMRRGYGAQMIRWLLETATQAPLPSVAEQQLQDWQKRDQAYQVEQVYLLSVKQPSRLADLLRQNRFRRYVQRQLSPRHAIIAGEMIPVLTKWLQKRDYALSATIPNGGNRLLSPEAEETGYDWLGLRLLIGLGTMVPLPYPPPYARLNAVGETLDAQRRSELENVVEEILSRVQIAIRGRDAFFPASETPPPALTAHIEATIMAEGQLHIQYQSLGDIEARWRCIQPLRLEQRGQLYYLVAYCYQAEDNRVFRLDRIKACAAAT